MAIAEPQPTRPPAPAGRPAGRRRLRGPMRLLFGTLRGLLGLTIVVLALLAALLAPVLAPYDPLEQHRGHELSQPSAQYVLGTDELGRDVLSRIIYGTRTALSVALAAVLVGGTVGTVTGLISGFYGGLVDAALMRSWDVLLAFPAVLVGVAVTAALGPGSGNAAIAVAIVNIPIFSRLVRATVLVEVERDYVQAARAAGAGDARILLRHLLPNTLSPVIVQGAVATAYAIMLEAGLSFLGLGTQPPTPSWGGMLNQSRSLLMQAPWYALFPGLALCTLQLGLGYLGDTLRDALDPRQARAGKA